MGMPPDAGGREKAPFSDKFQELCKTATVAYGKLRKAADVNRRLIFVDVDSLDESLGTSLQKMVRCISLRQN